jgi:hypothetical protein
VVVLDLCPQQDLAINPGGARPWCGQDSDPPHGLSSRPGPQLSACPRNWLLVCSLKKLVASPA